MSGPQGSDLMQAVGYPRTVPWTGGDTAAYIIQSLVSGLQGQHQEALQNQQTQYVAQQQAYAAKTQQMQTAINMAMAMYQQTGDGKYLAQAIALQRMIPPSPGMPALQAPPTLLGKLIPGQRASGALPSGATQGSSGAAAAPASPAPPAPPPAPSPVTPGPSTPPSVGVPATVPTVTPSQASAPTVNAPSTPGQPTATPQQQATTPDEVLDEMEKAATAPPEYKTFGEIAKAEGINVPLGTDVAGQQVRVIPGTDKPYQNDPEGVQKFDRLSSQIYVPLVQVGASGNMADAKIPPSIQDALNALPGQSSDPSSPKGAAWQRIKSMLIAAPYGVPDAQNANQITQGALDTIDNTLAQNLNATVAAVQAQIQDIQQNGLPNVDKGAYINQIAGMLAPFQRSRNPAVQAQLQALMKLATSSVSGLVPVTGMVNGKPVTRMIPAMQALDFNMKQQQFNLMQKDEQIRTNLAVAQGAREARTSALQNTALGLEIQGRQQDLAVAGQSSKIMGNYYKTGHMSPQDRAWLAGHNPALWNDIQNGATQFAGNINDIDTFMSGAQGTAIGAIQDMNLDGGTKDKLYQAASQIKPGDPKSYQSFLAAARKISPTAYEALWGSGSPSINKNTGRQTMSLGGLFTKSGAILGGIGEVASMGPDAQSTNSARKFYFDAAEQYIQTAAAVAETPGLAAFSPFANLQGRDWKGFSRGLAGVLANAGMPQDAINQVMTQLGYRDNGPTRGSVMEGAWNSFRIMQVTPPQSPQPAGGGVQFQLGGL